jgi:hypothetical protein
LSSCTNDLCAASCDSSLTSSTDQNPYTGSWVSFNQAEGRSWAVYNFPNGITSDIANIYIRGIWPVSTILYGIVGNNSLVTLQHLTTTNNYLDISIATIKYPLKGVRLESVTRDGLMRGFCYGGVGDCQVFLVTDIAVQTKTCYEEIVANFGEIALVDYAIARFSVFVNGSYATSLDGLNFVNRGSLLPFVNQNGNVKLSFKNVSAQYVRFRCLFIS